MCHVSRIRYRAPYDWDAILAFLAARAIPGVELVGKNTYQRAIQIQGRVGAIDVEHLPREESLSVSIRFSEVRAHNEILERVRRLFDLDADIGTIEEHLAADTHLGSWVVKHTGLRSPGGWDGFELGLRAVLGQQVTVAAARQLAGKLASLHGRRLPKAIATPDGITHVFPTSKRILSVGELGVGMPRSRLATLKALAQAAVDDPHLFHPSGNLETAIARLLDIPGIGHWTAQYIALRAIREADAFPASDIGLLRGAARIYGQTVTPKALMDYAEAWRPWRGYAAQHLWAVDGSKAG